MPGRAKCPPGCACEKHNRQTYNGRPVMSPEEAQARQNERARTHYEAHREEILNRQRQRRSDPVAGEERRRQQRERVAALSPAERERRAQLNRDWYRQNPRSPEENAKAHMKHRYGMSPEQRMRMVEDQDGGCYLCGEPLDLAHPRKVHVDHDHACCRGSRSCGVCIRGLACDPCNRGIGYFRDDTDRMRRVAANLDAANAKVTARQAAQHQQEALPIEIKRAARQQASG